MTFTAHDIAGLGTILGIWAHPDDETWCMGGIFAQASQNGQRVICITATCGEAAPTNDESKWPQDKMGEIRRKEMTESLKALGVYEHRWLECNDGKLQTMDPHIYIEAIRSIILEVQPNTIFSFGDDGLTGHSDHKTIYSWTKQALLKSGLDCNFYSVIETSEHYNSDVCFKADQKFNIFFARTKPKTISKSNADIYYELPDTIRDKKFNALLAHACQIDRYIQDTDGYNFVISLCKTEAFMKEHV